MAFVWDKTLQINLKRTNAHFLVLLKEALNSFFELLIFKTRPQKSLWPLSRLVASEHTRSDLWLDFPLSLWKRDP